MKNTTTAAAEILPPATLISLATAAAESAYDAFGTTDQPSPAMAWDFIFEATAEDDHSEVSVAIATNPGLTAATPPQGWATAYRQAFRLVATAAAEKEAAAAPAQPACVVCGGTAFDYLSRCANPGCVAIRVSPLLGDQPAATAAADPGPWLTSATTATAEAIAAVNTAATREALGDAIYLIGRTPEAELLTSLLATMNRLAGK